MASQSTNDRPSSTPTENPSTPVLNANPVFNLGFTPEYEIELREWIGRTRRSHDREASEIAHEHMRRAWETNRLTRTVQMGEYMIAMAEERRSIEDLRDLLGRLKPEEKIEEKISVKKEDPVKEEGNIMKKGDVIVKEEKDVVKEEISISIMEEDQNNMSNSLWNLKKEEQEEL